MLSNKKIIGVVVVLFVVALAFWVYQTKVAHKQPTKVIPYKAQIVATTTTTTNNVSFTKAPGYIAINLGNKAPTIFPKGLPIELNPIQIIFSYTETFGMGTSTNEQPRTEITYSYVTGTPLLTAGNAFETYFKANGYTVEKKYDAKIPLYSLIANSTSGTTTVFSVTIAVHDKVQKQQIVKVGGVIKK